MLLRQCDRFNIFSHISTCLFRHETSRTHTALTHCRPLGIAAGADDYLAKPFSARELLSRVASRIELARHRSLAARREQQLRFEAEQASAVKDRFLAV